MNDGWPEGTTEEEKTDALAYMQSRLDRQPSRAVAMDLEYGPFKRRWYLQLRCAFNILIDAIPEGKTWDFSEALVRGINQHFGENVNAG